MIQKEIIENKRKKSYLDELEKQTLLDKLKKRLKEINFLYQKMTHRNNHHTRNQIKRREFLEATLATIEKDIRKLSFKDVKIDPNA